jgi:outer membrane protein
MNRFFTLFLVFATFTIGSHAQTSSGNMMVGGGLRFSSTSYENGSVNDISTVTFSPGFAYFIRDNFAVGATLGMMSSREGTGPNKTLRSSLGFGPFARYYIFTSNDRFGFFGQAQLEFSGGKTDPATGNLSRNNAVSFSLSPGAAFFFNEHWALEFSVTGFTFTSGNADTDSDGNKYTRVVFGLDSFSPGLGFRYHF